MLKLRPYKDSDAPFIISWIKNETTFRMWCADKYERYPIHPEDMREFYEKQADDGEFWAMTAIDETSVIGHLTMRFTDAAKTQLRFGFVIVDDSRRNQGYGKEMLVLALQYAFQILKVQKVTLGVFEDNTAAFQLYRSVGFVQADQEKEIYHFPWGDGKCIEMEVEKERIHNHIGLLDQIAQQRKDGVYQDQNLLFLCMEIEDLENINAIYGHTEGDVAIRILAQVTEVSLPAAGVCGHLGGNEFVVALSAAQGEEENRVGQFMAAVTEKLDTYNALSGKEYSLAVQYSYISRRLEEQTEVSQVLEEALQHKRMYKERQGFAAAKRKKSRQYFEPQEEVLIKSVIDENRFLYAFQPIVEVKTGEIYGYEALMRTQGDPGIAPTTILLYADLHDRLYDVERATLFNVTRSVWENREAFQGRKIFVNSIPGHQLDDEDYSGISEICRNLAGQLMIEITEQTELDDEGLQVVLERSTRDGFGIAIDDYGSGYSNTSSLLRYLPNCVKIDHLLISNIQEEPKKQHFVKSIIEFSHDNGILVLAEGVETRAEMRAVIGMGVDLIQGFYTAPPSLEILQQIPDKIRGEILHARMGKESQITRKIYMVDGDGELPLMRLALEDYTGLLIADHNVVLTGNPDYTASLAIRIKDGAQAKLTLRNVHLEGMQDMPCIDIGKGARLKLVIEGENGLNNTGIRVPEESELRLSGAGNLAIRANGISCYGIGNGAEQGVGSIASGMFGNLDIRVEGSRCIAIGGGVYRQGKGVQVTAGNINIEVAGENSVGIGCEEGDMPISLSHCSMTVDFKVYAGPAIGTLKGNQNIRLSSIFLQIEGSGSKICGIGSTESSGGLVEIQNGKVIISMNGQNVKLLGSAGGEMQILAKESNLQLKSEGSNVLAVGCEDMSARINTRNAAMSVDIHAGVYRLVGAQERNVCWVGGDRDCHVNED